MGKTISKILYCCLWREYKEAGNNIIKSDCFEREENNLLEFEELKNSLKYYLIYRNGNRNGGT